MKLVFATANRHKLQEVSQILGPSFTLLTTADCGLTGEIPEDYDNLESNAMQKAICVKEKTGFDCFADDTGLEVTALGGAPGARSARYASDTHDFAANTELLLKNLEGISDRSARFRTIIVLSLDGWEYFFEGKVSGRISLSPAGHQGFGYDSVFIPDGYDMTFAQLSPEVKNGISHRGEAVRKLAEFLKTYKEGGNALTFDL